MSVSSSSDEEDNLELLKEAVDPTFLISYTQKNRNFCHDYCTPFFLTYCCFQSN